MGLEKRLERIANHYGYPEDLPSTVSEDARDALGTIVRLGAERDRLDAELTAKNAENSALHAALQAIQTMWRDAPLKFSNAYALGKAMFEEARQASPDVRS